MNVYQSTFGTAFSDLYERVVLYLPNILLAAVLVILGWILGSFLSGLVERGLRAVRIDDAAKGLGMDALSARTGRPLSLAKGVGWLVRWFCYLGSFFAAASVLGLPQVSAFLYQDVLGYAGRVMLAVAVLLLGALAANFFSQLVSSVVRASGVHEGSSLGAVTRWAIVAFSIIVALEKLGLAAGLLQDLFRAIIAMLAIAGGLAFGLGGRDHAKKVLDKIESDLSR